MTVFVALDQGTTSSRALVFDQGGRILGSYQKELSQIYPKPGWVEHNPDEILSGQIEALQKAVQLSGVNISDIAAIGITNQPRDHAVVGIKTPASACTTPSAGSAAVPRLTWSGWWPRGKPRPSAKRPGWYPTRIFPARSWLGFWTR